MPDRWSPRASDSGYVYDKPAIQDALRRVAARRDLTAILTELRFHPFIDEVAATVGEGAAANVVRETADLYTAAVAQAVASDDGTTDIDFRPAVERIGGIVVQSDSAAFLRGVLVGLALGGCLTTEAQR